MRRSVNAAAEQCWRVEESGIVVSLDGSMFVGLGNQSVEHLRHLNMS